MNFTSALGFGSLNEPFRHALMALHNSCYDPIYASSGQSNKSSTIVNYDSRVVLRSLQVKTTLE